MNIDIKLHKIDLPDDLKLGNVIAVDGSTGNRLWQFSYLIAFGIENKTFVAYPGFNEYAKYFKGIFAVSFGSFCLNDPPAAFLGFAKLSFIVSKSFFPI